MSERFEDELAAAGQRLEALARRVAALRESLRPPAPGPAAPLFPASDGAGALDDLELHFEIDAAEIGSKPGKRQGS